MVGDVRVPNENSRRKQGKAKKNQKPAQGKPRASKKKLDALEQRIFGNNIKIERVKPLAPKAPRVPFASGMTPCAFKYACAISDPWSDRARGACIPMPPLTHSMKVSSFTRFTFATGTNVGFVVFTPSLGSDTIQGFYSLSTYSAADADAYVGGNNTLNTGVATFTMGNLPFTGSNLSSTQNNVPAVQGRIVSYTYKVTYTGTTMNEGGIYYNYVSPTHGNLSGSSNYLTQANLGAALETEVCGTTREPCYNTIFASVENEMMYASDAEAELAVLNAPTARVYPYSINQGVSATAHSVGGYTYQTASSIYVGGPVGVIMTTGASGTYLCEVVMHAEYIGDLAASMATPNHADPEGTQKVLAAANTLTVRRLANPTKSIVSLMADGLREAYAVVKPIAIDALVSGVKMAAVSMLV